MKRKMLNIFILFPLLSFFIFTLFSMSAIAGFRIAVVGKTLNDSFYEQAFAGCQEFAQTVPDLECIYDGPTDFQDPRAQALVLEELSVHKIDGLLLSTTDSDFVVSRILKSYQTLNIPVITFDSDLLEKHAPYRLAYVGTNNFDFGVALGNYAKRYKAPNETREICIQSGSKTTPNLNERIRGVRYALSGQHLNRPLAGQNGWIEHKRCPFYTNGKRDMALKQLEYILNAIDQIVFVAVAGFAQFSPDYISKITPFKDQIKTGKKVVISADAEKIQIEALKLGLSTVNIGQRPFEMGRYSAELMYRYLKNNIKPEQEVNFLGFYYCNKINNGKCTLKPE